MLLVHDGQRKTPNPQTLFQQCVRADEQISRTGRNGRKYPTPRLCFQPGMQHRNPQARLAAPVGQGAPMLLGQHFGGSHEQTLSTGPCDQQSRSERHCGLAAAHVALKQPLHRRRAGQVRKQNSHGAFLRRRGRKGQRAAHRRQHRFAIDVTTPARGVAGASPFQGQPDLHHEQVLEGQAHLRRGLPGQELCQFLAAKRGLGLMDLAQRLGDRGKAETLGHAPRQHIGHQSCRPLDRRGHQLFDDPARNLLHRRVARPQPEAGLIV